MPGILILPWDHQRKGRIFSRPLYGKKPQHILFGQLQRHRLESPKLGSKEHRAGSSLLMTEHPAETLIGVGGVESSWCGCSHLFPSVCLSCLCVLAVQGPAALRSRPGWPMSDHQGGMPWGAGDRYRSGSKHTSLQI